MRPCVKKEASSDDNRGSGQVLRGNADLTLRGLRRDKTRTPVAGGHLGWIAPNSKKIAQGLAGRAKVDADGVVKLRTTYCAERIFWPPV
jgi:hypothetical protein